MSWSPRILGRFLREKVLHLDHPVDLQHDPQRVICGEGDPSWAVCTLAFQKFRHPSWYCDTKRLYWMYYYVGVV